MASVLSIGVADLAKQVKPTEGIGSISADEFGALLAQKSRTVAAKAGNVDYSAMLSQVSDQTGVGKYGISADTLERTGFLKAGTTDRFLKSGTNSLNTVLNNPGVWSGKDGINSIDNVLGNETVQTDIATAAFKTSLKDLQDLNILSGAENSSTVAALTNVTTEFGVDNAAKWLNNDIADAAMGLNMDQLARSGIMSADFVASKAASLSNLGSIQDLTKNLPGLGTASNQFSKLAGSIGGISAVAGPAGNIIGSVKGSLGGALGSAGALGDAVGSLFNGASGSGSATKIRPAQVRAIKSVANTVQREGLDSVMQSLLGSTRAAVPNFSGIVNASAFELPSLSGLVNQAQQLDPGKPVLVTRCDGAAELIAPTKAECESAGGTWVEYYINSNGKRTAAPLPGTTLT